MTATTNRILIVYSGVLTAVVAIGLLTGTGLAAPRVTSFDEIDVKRINLREDDGTLRYVLSNTSHFPGLIIHGKEVPHPSGRREAGILFFNEEGTENGGLVWSGQKKDGKVSSGSSLTFDQYDQDQVVQLMQGESNGHRRAGLAVWDRPDTPIDLDLANKITHMPPGPARDAELKRVKEAGTFGTRRLEVGKSEDRSAMVDLRDAHGRSRLRMRVAADGAATIEFLDEQGKVARTIGPDDKTALGGK